MADFDFSGEINRGHAALSKAQEANLRQDSILFEI